MKVVLIQPATSFQQIYGDWDLSSLDTYSPPLGILYIASFIRQSGHTPLIVDLQANHWTIQDTLDYLAAQRPGVVGISSMTINFASAVKLASAVKDSLPGIPIALGGPHITATGTETMQRYPCFDYGVMHEGEVTFNELLCTLENGTSLSGVQGLIWRTPDTCLRINEPRPFIQDLDSLPLPAWDLLDGFPQRYPHSILESRRLPAASIMTSRGCPFSCAFCDNKIFGTRVRQFSAEYTIKMIEFLIENYAIKDLMILDDNFLLDKRKLFSVCDTIIARQLDLTWYCMGHAKTMTEDRLAKIHAAGCWFIELGIESGNDSMLKRIGKNTTKAEIANAVSLARKHRLKTKGNFIFGLPGDTLATIDESIQFALDIKLDYFQQNFLTVWPGCPVHDWVEHGVESYEYYDSNWENLAHQRITFVPKGLKKADLIERSKKAFRRFYLRPRIVASVAPLMFSRRGLKFLWAASSTFWKTAFRKSA